MFLRFGGQHSLELVNGVKRVSKEHTNCRMLPWVQLPALQQALDGTDPKDWTVD